MTARRLPHNCLTTAWKLPDKSLKTAWRLPDDCLMTAWWLSDNCLKKAWQKPDDCLMTAWQLPDNFLTTFCQLPNLLPSKLENNKKPKPRGICRGCPQGPELKNKICPILNLRTFLMLRDFNERRYFHISRNVKIVAYFAQTILFYEE